MRARLNAVLLSIAAASCLSAPSFAAVPYKAYQAYTDALISAKLGNYEQAIYSLEAVIESDGNAVSAYKDLTLLYWQMGRQNDALQTVNILKRIDGENVSTQLFLGSFYVMSGQDQLAIEALDKVLKIEPGNETALLYLAVHTTEKEPERSIAYWEQYLKTQPDYADGWHQLGLIQSKLGMPDKAVVSLEKCVAADPNGISARLALADLYERQSQNRKAAEQYERSIELNPKDAAVAAHLAGLYYKMGELDPAEKMFLRARELNPGDTSIDYWLSVVYEDKKDTNAAIKHLEVYSKSSKNAVIFTRLGYLYSIKRDYKNSIKYLNKAAELDPNNPYCHFLIGLNYMDQRKYGPAAKSLTRAVELKPDMAEGHFQLGVALDLSGNFEKAVPSLEKTLELKPDFAVALNYLGYSLADRDRDLARAEALIGKALELDPQNTAYQDSLGWVSYKLGNYEKAEKYLSAASQNSSDPLIFEHLGDALMKLGRKEDAWDAYKGSLARNPKNSKAAARIKELEKFVLPGTMQRKTLKRAVGNLLQVRTLKVNFTASGEFSSNNIHTLGVFTYERPARWRADLLGSFYAPSIIAVFDQKLRIYPESLAGSLDPSLETLLGQISAYFNGGMAAAFDSDNVSAVMKSGAYVYTEGTGALSIDTSNGAIKEYKRGGITVKFGKYEWVEGLFLPKSMDIYMPGAKAAAKIKFQKYQLNTKLKEGAFEFKPKENVPDADTGPGKN